MELHCQPNECFKNTLTESPPNSFPVAADSVSSKVLEGRTFPLPTSCNVFEAGLWERLERMAILLKG